MAVRRGYTGDEVADVFAEYDNVTWEKKFFSLIFLTTKVIITGGREQWNDDQSTSVAVCHLSLHMLSVQVCSLVAWIASLKAVSVLPDKNT